MAALFDCVVFSFVIVFSFILNTPGNGYKLDDALQFFSPHNHLMNGDHHVHIQLLPDVSATSEPQSTKSMYHVIKKRSTTDNNPPLKKAVQNEKKVSPKGLPPSITDVAVNIKKMLNQHKSAIDNATSDDSNSLDGNSSTPETVTANEKYTTNATNSSSTTTTSTSTTTASTISTTTNTSTTTTVAPVTLVPVRYVTTAKISTTTWALIDNVPTRPSNITNTTEDYHVYYNSTVFLEEDKAMLYWVDFETLPKSKVVIHPMLSDSYRRAATVTLSFDFPFYGHPLRNITIATGGFLFMGDYMHSWLAATQYVAPLMANFDTSLSNSSYVKYYDNGTAFVIEWNEVALQDEKQGGNFTFQATLMKNGNIVFVYQSIPVSVTEIGDESHPVKVGLSDAYVIDRVIYFIRRKTIYEYHRVNMKKEEIGNHTAIYFTALSTCLKYRDCKTCMSADIGLECVWCESARRCSDGLDRHRQSWLQHGCDMEKSSIDCSLLPSSNKNPIVQPYTEMPAPKQFTIYTPTDDHVHNNIQPHGPFHPLQPNDDEVVSHRLKGEDQGALGVGGVVAILLILGILLGGATWVGYAYRNPHTSSGQLLIRYRPSQWRFRSGEARYTAASVHM